VDDVVQLLLHGADKVAIGSTAFSVIKPAAQKLGTQAIVAMVDYDIDGMVTVGGAMVDALSYAQMCEKQGAGEVVLQSKVRDGTMAGYDIKMLQRVASQLSIPVIVAGGCRDVSDMSIALRSGAQGVAVGALFQFCDITPREAAQVLKACGHEVRL
jgi:imidazole glycerol phosphate synthase subunit HisF